MEDKINRYHIVIPVGDPHIRKEDIPEAKKFIKWLIKSAFNLYENTGDKILVLFMGDQLNDFGIARAEVLEFWKWAYDEFKPVKGAVDTMSLIGNHDMNQEESASTMSVYDQRTILAGREPVFINNTAAAIGFVRSEDVFRAHVIQAYNAGARTIFCHAEFEGSQYESGTYAPNGFKLDRYPDDLSFITGHIHKQQQFGKVWCVGTPRHLTKSDIGEVKGVNALNLTNGVTLFSPTPEDVFESFKSIVLEESPTFDEKVIKDIKDSTKVYIEIKGSRDFCKKIARLIPSLCKVRSTYTDLERTATVKESEGIPKTFAKFSDEYFKTHNVPDHVKKAILDKVFKRCPSLKDGVR
jgi:hypothetical protein